jgi:hypothetical protein
VANLNAEQLRRLARLGAMARLTQIREEEAAIREEFPELFGHGMPAPGRGRRGRQRVTSIAEDAPAPGEPTRRRRRKMSAAGRKAVSIRMRKYWAARRKAKGRR